MNWYLTTLVFHITNGEQRHTAEFDEQLRLVSAQSASQALQKARLLGQAEEQSAQSGANVSWRFIDVKHIAPVGEWHDGMEFTSQVKESYSAEHYIYVVKDMARRMEQNMLQPA